MRWHATASLVRSKRAAYDESLEVLFDILVEDPQAGWVHFIDMRHQGVIPTFLKHHAASPCTDGFALSPEIKYEDGLFLYGVCPNYFSLFPHYIEKYVRQDAVLSLEEAVRKATSVPAKEVLGLDDRGVFNLVHTQMWWFSIMKPSVPLVATCSQPSNPAGFARCL